MIDNQIKYIKQSIEDNPQFKCEPSKLDMILSFDFDSIKY